MKVIAEIEIETDEFPDRPEQAREKAVNLLKKKFRENLTDNDVEDFELLSLPAYRIKEVDA